MENNLNLELEKFALYFNNTYIRKNTFTNNFEGSFERIKQICFHSNLKHEISSFQENDQFFKLWLWLDMQIVYQQDFSKSDDYNNLVKRADYDDFTYALGIGLNTLETMVYLFQKHTDLNKNLLMNYLNHFNDLLHFNFTDNGRVDLNDYYDEIQVKNIQSLFDDYILLRNEIKRYFDFFKFKSANLTTDIEPNLDVESFGYLDIQEYQLEFDSIESEAEFNNWIEENGNWNDDLNIHSRELNWLNPNYD